MHHINISTNQTAEAAEVRIFIEDTESIESLIDCFISAIKRYGEDVEIYRSYGFVHKTKRSLSIAEARIIILNYNLAIQAGEILNQLLMSQSDFSQTISARVEGQMIHIEFEE